MVRELLKGPLGEVFDHQQLLTDVSGSGNNWYDITVKQGTLVSLNLGANSNLQHFDEINFDKMHQDIKAPLITLQ